MYIYVYIYICVYISISLYLIVRIDMKKRLLNFPHFKIHLKINFNFTNVD